MRNRIIISAISLLMSLIFAQAGQAKPGAAPFNNIKVKVTPHGTYAEFTIDLAEGAPALLQVARNSPQVNTGVYPKDIKNMPALFGPGSTVFTKVLNERNEAGAFLAQQKLDTLLPNGAGALNPGTIYYYAVQVIEKDGGKRIVTGSFKTKFRAVDIYITEIHVLNDSDSSGDGEISFNFFLDNKHVFKIPTGQTTYSLNDHDPPLKFGDGLVLKPSNPSSYTDYTILTVEGWDDDTSSFSLSNCGTSGVVNKPNDQSGEDNCGEWTVTSKKINFTSPNAVGSKENFGKSYVLHGVGGNGSELEFEVYVTVKVHYVTSL